MEIFDEIKGRFLTCSLSFLPQLQEYLYRGNEIVHLGKALASVEEVDGELMITFLSEGNPKAMTLMNKILSIIESEYILRKVSQKWFLIKKSSEYNP